MLGNVFGSRLNATLGVNNVDDEIPYVPFPGFHPFIPSLDDARMVWLRLGGEF